MHANIVFDGDTWPRMYTKRAYACVRVRVRTRVGTATETKFDCREAKGLFYTLQTNRMRDAK